MLESYYTKEHHVKFFECDFQGNMQFPSLMCELIHVSSLQWNETVEKLGKERLEDKSLVWILTRYQADIKRMPRYDEKIILGTEYKTYDKLFAYRYFDVLDEDGDVLIHIESVFALLNIDSRRMARMEDEYFEGFKIKEPKSERIKRYPAIRDVDESQEVLRRDYYVRYYDIDANRHVNNRLYAEWAIDVLGADFLRAHQMTFFAIKFDKEVYYSDHVLSRASLSEGENGQVISAHRIETDGKLNAEVEIHWKKNEEEAGKS